MQRRTILIPLAVVALLAVVFVAFPPSGDVHVDCVFPIRVTGRLVASADGDPIRDALIITAPSRSTAVARIAGGSYRERIDEWIAYNDAEKAAGRGAAEPRLAPWGAGGARTREDGTFSTVQTLLWSYDRFGWSQSRPSQPPPRYHVEALAIEIEGSAPMILDVPEGTWTEHPDEDDLWATWDLGVVAVPGMR